MCAGSAGAESAGSCEELLLRGQARARGPRKKVETRNVTAEEGGRDYVGEGVRFCAQRGG